MSLLIDTDAFCKLGAANLLADAVDALGLTMPQCARLPALPRMLRKGGLRKRFGNSACDALQPLADSLPSLPRPDDAWLEKLTRVSDIDPGEAQMYAVAATGSMLVLSGDKRALRALAGVQGLSGALAGRVVVLEAILIVLCESLGVDVVRGRIQLAALNDIMLCVCFSPGNPDPHTALLAYYGELVSEVGSLVLWSPLGGDRT